MRYEAIPSGSTESDREGVSFPKGPSYEEEEEPRNSTPRYDY